MQLRDIRLEKKYPFVYKFTGKVGPLTVAVEDKSLMHLCVDAVFLI